MKDIKLFLMLLLVAPASLLGGTWLSTKTLSCFRRNPPAAGP